MLVSVLQTNTIQFRGDVSTGSEQLGSNEFPWLAQRLLFRRVVLKAHFELASSDISSSFPTMSSYYMRYNTTFSSEMEQSVCLIKLARQNFTKSEFRWQHTSCSGI